MVYNEDEEKRLEREKSGHDGLTEQERHEFNPHYESGGKTKTKKENFDHKEMIILRAVYATQIQGLEGQINYFKGQNSVEHKENHGISTENAIRGAKLEIEEVKDNAKFLDKEKYPYDITQEYDGQVFLRNLNDLVRTNEGRRLFEEDSNPEAKQYYDAYLALYDKLEKLYDAQFGTKFARGGEVKASDAKDFIEKIKKAKVGEKIVYTHNAETKEKSVFEKKDNRPYYTINYFCTDDDGDYGAWVFYGSPSLGDVIFDFKDKIQKDVAFSSFAFAKGGETKKKLKVWNGGRIYVGKYKNCHVNVAAYSQQGAVDLINEHVPNASITVGELKKYYADVWGNDMAGITPTEPCLYVVMNNKRTKLFGGEVMANGGQVKKTAIKIIRVPEKTGRANMLINNDLRSYKIMVGNIHVGNIFNVSATYMTRDNSREWAIRYYADGGDVVMKKKFKEEDVASAIKYAEETTKDILKQDSAAPKLKERMIAQFREFKNKNV